MKVETSCLFSAFSDFRSTLLTFNSKGAMLRVPAFMTTWNCGNFFINIPTKYYLFFGAKSFLCPGNACNFIIFNIASSLKRFLFY